MPIIGHYQDNCKIKFTDTHVKFEGFSSSRKRNKQKLNWVKLSEKSSVPNDVKYYNPGISYNGTNWFISIGVDYEPTIQEPV